jgi:predicted RND superfamily exporter protein
VSLKTSTEENSMHDQRIEKNSLAARYGRWLIRWRGPVLLASLIGVIAAASGGRFLGFSNDYRAFFSDENPQMAAFEGLQNIYTKNDNILIAVAPEDGDVFTRETLTAVEELTAEAWKLPYVLRVDALTNYQHTEATEDDLLVRDLVVDAAVASDEDLEEARRIALAEPLLARRLISDRGHVTAVNVTLQLPGESPQEPLETVKATRELLERIEAVHPGIETHLTGNVMLSQAFFENSLKDMTTLIPIMYLAIIVSMIVLLRSVSATVATVVVIGASVATALGLTGWAGVLLTPPSSTAPTMIMTLAVAESVQILVKMLAEMRHGRSKFDAIVESLRVNLQPVFLTSLTTAIGFLSMNFSDSPPFRDLGNIAAVGVTAAFVFSVSTLPALMAVLPVRVKAVVGSSHGFMDRLGSLVVARRRPLLWGSTGVALLLAALVPKNELNDQFVEYFDETVTFRTDTDFVTDNLTGIYQVEFSIGAGESGGVSEPAYLAKLDEFTEWYGAQPGVVQVNSFSQIMKRLNKTLNGDSPEFYRIPEKRELAAQYLLLYELSLPYGLDLNNQINVDRSATKVVVSAGGDLTTKKLRALTDAGHDWLAENAPEAMLATGAGPGVMFSHISDRQIRGMITGTILAFILVSLILVVALRSVRFGLISLIPNMLPALMAFGVWGLLVGRVNIGLSTVVAMTIGIVVDDTVHFLSKYLRARRERGMGAPEAVQYAFRTVGAALLFTSVILAVGFAILAQSAFDLNAGMGKLTAVTIAMALTADFFFLPPLLMKVEEWVPLRAHIPIPLAGPLPGPAPEPVTGD